MMTVKPGQAARRRVFFCLGRRSFRLPVRAIAGLTLSRTRLNWHWIQAITLPAFSAPTLLP